MRDIFEANTMKNNLLLTFFGALLLTRPEIGNVAPLPTEQTPAEIKIEQSSAVITIWYITDPKRKKEIQRSFQLNLSKMGSSGKIVSCDPIVAVSRIQEGDEVTQGRELSYAAACHIQVGSKHLYLEMCDFPMVGKFTISASGGITLEWFAQFIRNNCPAGG